MKKIKIAIIGAGPSGFGAAETFRSKAFKDSFDVTIYERNSYVGGKCCTVDANGHVTNGNEGGYEMGAVIIAKHSPHYSQVSELISRHDIGLTPFKEPGRRVFHYVNNGRAKSIRQPYLPQLLSRPGSFIKALRNYDEYVIDYAHYSLRTPVGYVNRPRVLSKNLSKLYTKTVYKRLSSIMQGFGYADMDDRHLTPPLLYYHQYIEPRTVELPVYSVNQGTQGIWAALAKTYPKGSIRLNETVEHIERHPERVHIKTNHDVQDYDYVVVATPFKPALKFLDATPQEKQFLGKMKHNHYVTVLCRAESLGSIAAFNVSACTDRRKLGSVVCAYQRYPDSDHLVAYLYIKPGTNPSNEQIVKSVEKSLRRDFAIAMKDKQHAKVFHWDDYFGHLNTKSIKAGWYEEFDKYYQGRYRTLWVSSGLHMETVGASFEYGKVMAAKYAKLWRGTKPGL